MFQFHVFPLRVLQGCTPVHASIFFAPPASPPVWRGGPGGEPPLPRPPPETALRGADGILEMAARLPAGARTPGSAVNKTGRAGCRRGRPAGRFGRASAARGPFPLPPSLYTPVPLPP